MHVLISVLVVFTFAHSDLLRLKKTNSALRQALASLTSRAETQVGDDGDNFYHCHNKCGGIDALNNDKPNYYGCFDPCMERSEKSVGQRITDWSNLNSILTQLNACKNRGQSDCLNDNRCRWSSFTDRCTLNAASESEMEASVGWVKSEVDGKWYKTEAELPENKAAGGGKKEDCPTMTVPTYECSLGGELIKRSGKGTATEHGCMYAKSVVENCGSKDLCNASTKSCKYCSEAMGTQWGCYGNCVDQSNPEKPFIKWGAACIAKVGGFGSSEFKTGKCGDFASCMTTDIGECADSSLAAYCPSPAGNSAEKAVGKSCPGGKWYGKGPFCKGRCPAGYAQKDSQKEAESWGFAHTEWEHRKFGSDCWTGTKKYCCPP